MEVRPKSALSRLVNGLKREPHDYRVSLDVFPALNIDKLAGDLGLAKAGAERGAREEPASDTLALDDIENAVVERVEAEKNSAHGTLLDEVRTYKERLTGLDFEGRFGAIRQAAPAAVSEFRAEAAQGRDELHGLRRHLRDLELERDEFRSRHNLKRAAHWASGGNLTIKVGILLVLFVVEVFLNGFFLAKGSELGYLGGASEAFTFALLNIGVSFLIAVVGVRELNHRNPLRKAFGFFALLGYLVLLVAINLSLAHYREVSAALITDAGREVLLRLKTMPLALVDFKSWLLFGLGVLFFAGVGRLAKLPRATVGALIMVGALGNTSFVGLPMIEAFYGKELLGVGIIADQLGTFMVLATLGIVTATLYSSGAVSARAVLRRILLFPPFQALVIALLLRPFSYPEWLTPVLTKLGDTLTPLALVSVGFQLRLSHLKGTLQTLGLGLFFKLLLAPALLALLFVGVLGAHGEVIQVTIFEAAMAPMITAGIVAVDHDLNPPLVAVMIGIGIPLSFLTLTGWSYLLKALA